MDFYKIDEKYISFLQTYEKRKRGVTKVPNMQYSDRNKFAFGTVLTVNGMKYYVSVSSFEKKQEANILIRVPGDKKEVKGSLRFNYMVPVPDECLSRLVIREIQDAKYRTLLNKEFQFCQDNAVRIEEKAAKIYNSVVMKKKESLVNNSCDFKLLEEAYHLFIVQNGEKL